MQCCAVLVQDVTSLYSCVRVTTGEGGLFGGQCAYEGYLDQQPVFTSSSLSNAVISTFALYHVFAVHYPKKLLKTCTFLSSHIMGLAEKQIPAVQALFNSTAC